MSEPSLFFILGAITSIILFLATGFILIVIITWPDIIRHCSNHWLDFRINHTGVKVALPNSNDIGDEMEMLRWLQNNGPAGRYHYSLYNQFVWFAKKSDAVMFKMLWL